MAAKISRVKQARKVTSLVMRLTPFSRKNPEHRTQAANRIRGLRSRYKTGLPWSTRRGIKGMY